MSFFVFSIEGYTQEIYEYNQSVKDLGRGGVHILKETDGSAFLTNPAMLAFMKGIRWSILDFQGGVNGQNTYNLLQNYPISAANISHYYGQNVWLGFGGYTSFSMPYFGFAIIGNSYLNFLVTNPAFTTIDISSITDYGFQFGGAFNLSENFAFGATIKRVNRTGGSTSLGPGAIAGLNQAAIQNAISTAGVGYGGDLGLVWKGKNSVNPVVSLSWLDVGYTYFYPSTGTVGPPVQADNLVFNVTINQNYAGFGWGLGAEYRHIRNVEIEVSKKVHVGAELNLGLIDVRGGFYQGWMGYGASIDLWLFNLDAAVYKVERGVYAGQNGDDRFQIGLTLDAGFDPNFIMSGVGGKGRSKLKQRR